MAVHAIEIHSQCQQSDESLNMSFYTDRHLAVQGDVCPINQLCFTTLVCFFTQSLSPMWTMMVFIVVCSGMNCFYIAREQIIGKAVSDFEIV